VDGRYQVTDTGGKIIRLSEVSTGLKDLVGKTVIMDLNVLNSPTASDPTYKVITYTPMP
jgi:hypothetical protein